MRILVLTSMYPPHHLGGYEQSCRDAVERWRSHGHEVSVLVSTYRRPGMADDAALDEREEVRRELQWYWHDAQFLRPSPRRRLAIERHNQRRLAAALGAVHPDVVSVWHMGGMSLGLLTTLARRRTPLVYVVSDEWLGYGPQVDAWTSAWRSRPILARVVTALTWIPTSVTDLPDTGSFCFVSKWLQRRGELAVGRAFPRAQVVPAGIDTEAFPVVTDAEPRPWSDRLLVVGRVEPRKGVADVVEALVSLPGGMLTVVGPAEGGYDAILAAHADELGVGDRLVRRTSARAALQHVYRAADVVLFTPVWDEPFGLVPLEAMACGVPVIATGTGGSAEFLRHEHNCLLVAPRDPAAIAAGVRRLAADPGLRDRLRHEGARTASAYTMDRCADVLERVHREAAA